MQTASDAQDRGAELPLTLHANAQTLFGGFVTLMLPLRRIAVPIKA